MCPKKLAGNECRLAAAADVVIRQPKYITKSSLEFLMFSTCSSSCYGSKHLCKSGNLRVLKIQVYEYSNYRFCTKVIHWYGCTQKELDLSLQLRSLCRRRTHLVRQLRTIKNHIKSQLLYYGIKVPDEYDNPNWSHQMKTWLAAIEWKFTSAASAMKSRLKHLEFLWYEQLHISTELRAYCRKHYKKDYYLLKSVPGIGGITAAAILAELGDLRRFNRIDELAAIVGLVPGIYQSSDNRICLGLSKRSNYYIRSLLVEASWVAVRADMALQAYYRKHAAKEPNKAIIKVAHKLLSRIRAVIRSGVPYQSGLVK